MTEKAKRSPEEVVREIKRKTRSKFISEEKIRIVLEGLREEKRALLPSAVGKVLIRTCIIAGVKASWRQERSG